MKDLAVAPHGLYDDVCVPVKLTARELVPGRSSVYFRAT